MDLHEYLGVVRRQWISIGIVVLLAVAAAAVASLTMKPVYAATTQVFVSVRGGATTSDLLQGSSFTRQQVRSYVDIVTTPIVLAPVVELLGLQDDADALGERVTADSPPDTGLINIRVSAEDPQDASATANAIAASFRSAVADVETPEGGSTSPVKISVLREATAPDEPSSPNIPVNLALGLMIGLAIAVVYVVLRERLNTTVHDVEDVASVTSASVIGTIRHDSSAPRRPLAVRDDAYGARAEAYRRLRTNLTFLDVSDPPRSIVLTSAVPTEGTTTTMLNLGLAIADAGRSVIVVDANFRRPSVAEYMGLEGSAGLASVLIGAATPEEIVQPWGASPLAVMPSGQVPSTPSELLGSAAMEGVLAQLEAQYDVVLVDAPPLLPVTDAAVLSRLTSGAIVVVGCGRVHRHQLGEALRSLDSVRARILGLVLNRVQRSKSESYSSYDSRDLSRLRRNARQGAAVAVRK
ncbi:polysaccharide biosynthesis tyrosine autokinase [Georgenia yuyongxinii]|uniref:polysaccharide biosynthesis tyrosine autokinase n=1 Tax=Georgenia yuyongxinii TaxID=2589797 RepID=UPI00143DA901|nr:polysaccharide biosynthesis tyrosine autokinase [Georgenia yuyongxinii]